MSKVSHLYWQREQLRLGFRQRVAKTCLEGVNIEVGPGEEQVTADAHADGIGAPLFEGLELRAPRTAGSR